MRNLVNKILKQYLEYRFKNVAETIQNARYAQELTFNQLLERGRKTAYGEHYNFKEIKTYEAFAASVPIVDYEALKPWIQKAMKGEANILWPGQVRQFAKSSGTTNDKSKFIPVTSDSLKGCHLKSSWDTAAILYNMYPDARIFADKSLLLGGSLSALTDFPSAVCGDVSAILLDNMPAIGVPFYSPDFKTALLDNWEEKLEKMALQVQNEDITLFGGVPSWTMVLFDRLLEITGKSNMLEVWPKARFYLHGGVSFLPYKEQFYNYFPSDQLLYVEAYNASEGYFALQLDPKDTGMTLMLDNGIFYEFIPLNSSNDRAEAIPLWEVETAQEYSILITTNGGLWRYEIGDTVEFTSIDPYHIIITGRTKAYINVFGEEVMVGNTDRALQMTCNQFYAMVSEYTVAPKFLDKGAAGQHDWIIEFEKEPDNLSLFAKVLDENLKKLNSDYEAKRSNDYVLKTLKVNRVDKGTFYNWMKQKNKLGGQHKVPRLSNSRKHIEELLQLNNKNAN